ncbi:A-kinase anchor protein 7-like isoform X3 [Crassostrea virginica]
MIYTRNTLTQASKNDCKPYLFPRKIYIIGSQKHIATYNTDRLLAAGKPKKRDKRKRREKMSGTAETSEVWMKGPPRQPPNYFLAIQITEEEIKQNIKMIQNILLEKEEKLSSAMVEVASLHLTLGVYYLEDGWDVLQITRALDKFHKQLMVAEFVPPRLTVSALGHFRHKVLFASLAENEGLEKLNSLVNDVRTFLKENDVFPTDERYTPHITITKMSKDTPKLRKLGVRRIEPSHYEEKMSTHFGEQVVRGIQLCSMDKPKSDSGYYHVEHEIKFSV